MFKEILELLSSTLDETTLKKVKDDLEKKELEYVKLQSKVSLNDDDKKSLNDENSTLKDNLDSTLKKLGVKSIDEVDDRISKLLGDDDTLKKDYETIKQQLEKKTEEYEAKLKEKDQEVINMQLDLQLEKELSGVELASDVAKDFFLSKIKDGLNLTDDNSLQYRDANGKLVINEKTGKPISIQEKIDMLKTDESFSFLFKQQSNQGSGKKVNIDLIQDGKAKLSGSFEDILSQRAAEIGVSV